MAHKHTITQGESFVTVAEAQGFFALTLWDDAQNKDLLRYRQQRRSGRPCSPRALRSPRPSPARSLSP